MEKKKSHVKGIVIAVIIIAVVCGLGYLGITKAKQKVASTVGEKAVEKVAEQSGMPAEEANKIVDSMDEEDKKTVNKIVENHMDGKTIQKATELVKDHDIEGAKEYAQQQLTPEEQEQVKNIAKKYMDANGNIDYSKLPADVQNQLEN